MSFAKFISTPNYLLYLLDLVRDLPSLTRKHQGMGALSSLLLYLQLLEGACMGETFNTNH